MKKENVYVVFVVSSSDDERNAKILGNAYFDTPEDAARSMMSDFRREKGNFDGTDDVSEEHGTDWCILSANNEWSRGWRVLCLPHWKEG